MRARNLCHVFQQMCQERIEACVKNNVLWELLLKCQICQCELSDLPWLFNKSRSLRHAGLAGITLPFKRSTKADSLGDSQIQMKTFFTLQSVIVTVVRGCQERGGVELLLNTLFENIEIAGEQVHTKMTLILDTDAGKHRVLKGETKRGNWTHRAGD